MRAEVISIGTEILMGELVDTNSSYLASELAKLGIDLRWVSKVGDDFQRLRTVIDQAWRRSDVTLTTGGLGPTSDDLTREAVAAVLGEEMQVQDDLLEHLKSLFAGRGDPMPSTNVKQATLVPSAAAIDNPLGTAPGWWVERGGSIIVAMPGPPRELERMWTQEVAPKLRERTPGVAIVTKTFKTFGISEGGLNEMIAPLFDSENPYLGIYSKVDGIHLRAIATASTEEEGRRMIEPVELEIRRVAGDSIWGEDDETPELKVADLLKRSRRTLAILESFTGGLLASNLADVPGSERFLKGSIVASDPGVLDGLGLSRRVVDRFGAVSPQAAEEMARLARLRLQADVGVGVTGLVRESGSSRAPIGTSYIGFAVGEETSSVSGRYPTQRLRIRGRAATHALVELARLLDA
jgi:nicotinamide-nucleotide amidase